MWIDSYSERNKNKNRRVTKLVNIGGMTLLYDLKLDSGSCKFVPSCWTEKKYK